MNSTSPIIQGLVPPVPTPPTQDGKVDPVAFDRIAEHLHASGIDAAFVLGSTGECASLSLSHRFHAIDAASAAFSNRMPLLVGIGDPCIDHSLALAKHAAAANATALVLNAPSYYEISHTELRAYLDRIIPQLPLPVLLYNMPWLTGHSFDSQTLEHAASFPGLIGFKDSSGDLAYLQNLIRIASTRTDLSVLVGNDFLFLDALKLGAHGAVVGGAILYPDCFRKLLDAFNNHSTDLAESLQQEINRRGEIIFPATGNPSSVFAAIKGGLASLGLCRPDMAPPIQSCTPDLVAAIGRILNPAAAA